MVEHPTDLELELARTGEAGSEVGRHIEACQSCQARQEMLHSLAKELRLPAVEVPAGVAAKVERLAAKAAHRVGANKRRARFIPYVAAAIAATLLVVVPRVFGPEVASADINGDGRVDIVDALLLAQALERGESEEQWDLNHDSRVDAADVDALALVAVNLGGER